MRLWLLLAFWLMSCEHEAVQLATERSEPAPAGTVGVPHGTAESTPPETSEPEAPETTEPTPVKGVLGVVAGLTPSGKRDRLKWPFAVKSIWNMPIGSGATYVPARVPPAGERGMTTDEDIIVMRPDAPLVEVFQNKAGWSRADRCPAQGGLLATVPFPRDFVVGNGLPGTPNNGFAVLLQDRRTILQGQPLARCQEGGIATALWVGRRVEIDGPGIEGAHGGSMLSAIGGALRVGELRPGAQVVRHALKINLYAKRALFRCQSRNECYRWPALTADGYAVGNYGTLGGGGPAALKMGALLAIPSTTDLESLNLETEPARKIAWTLQRYGAYVVDDTAWDVYAFSMEVGPDGDFRNQFRQDYGFSFGMADKSHPWSRDMAKIFGNLAVVDNNGPNSIGGGGTPLEPLAPELE